jgi:hypothetical protein
MTYTIKKRNKGKYNKKQRGSGNGTLHNNTMSHPQPLNNTSESNDPINRTNNTNNLEQIKKNEESVSNNTKRRRGRGMQKFTRNAVGKELNQMAYFGFNPRIFRNFYQLFVDGRVGSREYLFPRGGPRRYRIPTGGLSKINMP